jgi:hypothetical protein
MAPEAERAAWDKEVGSRQLDKWVFFLVLTPSPMTMTTLAARPRAAYIPLTRGNIADAVLQESSR